MKKILLILITIICLASIVFAYNPTPAPALDPATVPFVYNTTITPAPIAWKIVSAGTTLKADQIVFDEHRDDITVTVTLPDNSVIIATEVSRTDDPADPDGDSTTPPDDNIIGLKYIYHWEWPTSIADVGVKHLKIKAMDIDGLFSEAGIVVYVKDNRPPIIGGCILN